MKAIRVNEYGSFEVLSYEDIEIPEPEENEILVKIEAVGVNFIDVYHRKGSYPLKLPFTLGKEGAGIVEKVGSEVSDFKINDGVACASCSGAYAEYAVFPADMTVKIPENIDTKTAAAVMLQGMTAHYLSHSTYKINENTTLLLHAAAGGVGLLLTQMAKMKNAKVIGTVSTKEKAKLAKKAGADEIINYKEKDFEEEVKKLTNGKGVDVVYDGVGKATFEKSLNCLKRRGIMVAFGQASGPIPEFDTQILNQKGGLYLTRPSLYHYIATKEELTQRANDIFKWIRERKLKIRIFKEYKLEEAKQAHEDLEGRKTAGKLLIIP